MAGCSLAYCDGVLLTMMGMPETEERVSLVNENDEEIGTAGEVALQRHGLLHRAFSRFVIRSRREMLRHCRPLDKYHGGCLWSNSACGYPKPGEDTRAAAVRRTREEMGFTCELEPTSALLYRTNAGGGLTV